MRVGSLWALAEEVASLGPDAVAMEPEDLVSAVVRALEAVRAGHDGRNPYENARSANETTTKIGGGE